jgi:hypothetical protein
MVCVMVCFCVVLTQYPIVFVVPSLYNLTHFTHLFSLTLLSLPPLSGRITGDVQVVMLDAGIITELEFEDRINFMELFGAIAEKDGRLAGQLMLEKARVNVSGVNVSGVNVSGGDVE